MNGRINKEHYSKIQHGMQRAEVVQLLGREPGDYTSGRRRLLFGELRRQSVPGTPQDWITDEVKVTVWFNDEGKVTESILLYNWDYQPSRWEILIRSWLRRLGF
jgi:hypothetical protein